MAKGEANPLDVSFLPKSQGVPDLAQSRAPRPPKPGDRGSKRAMPFGPRFLSSTLSNAHRVPFAGEFGKKADPE